MWKKTENEDSYLEDQTMSPVPTSVSAPEKAPSSGSATIGPSITINGDISGEEDLIIRGKVEGTVNLDKNNVVIGKDGSVKANVNAKVITVEGKVTGDLRGDEQIIIKRSGSVDGNISAPRLVLEDGCKFKGAVEMDDSKSKSESTSVKSSISGLGSIEDKKPNTDKSYGKKINDSL